MHWQRVVRRTGGQGKEDGKASWVRAQDAESMIGKNWLYLIICAIMFAMGSSLNTAHHACCVALSWGIISSQIITHTGIHQTVRHGASISIGLHTNTPMAVMTDNIHCQPLETENNRGVNNFSVRCRTTNGSAQADSDKQATEMFLTWCSNTMSHNWWWRINVPASECCSLSLTCNDWNKTRA